MNIRKKTPAELEHQVADYLLHNDSHPGMIRATHLGKMTQLLLEAEGGCIEEDERIQQHNPLAERRDLVEFSERYPRYLNMRSKLSYDREHYKQKANAIESYNNEFIDLVAAIDRHEETELVAGSYAIPYIIEKDGVQYIVRVIDPRYGIQQVEKHIDAALRVEDIDHLEHIVAVSYKDGITIAPLLPGRAFKFLGLTGGAEYVTHKQLRELYDAMKQANERGVGIDGIGGNIFYDQRHGFSVLDLEPLTTRSKAPAALLDQLKYLMQEARRNRDTTHMSEIMRIVSDVESILADDQDAREDLERLRNLRNKEQALIDKEAQRTKLFNEFDSLWRYTDDDYNW